MLCYRTPWGLTHCLTLLNAFCVRRVANASYFPMKWPFNSSPGHTGSMWRLLTLWSLASECWRTWKLTLLRREFASSVKNNIWFNSFLCEGEVQNIWWPHNNMIFTAMCCLWSIRLSHYSNSWLRFREHKIRTIIVSHHLWTFEKCACFFWQMNYNETAGGMWRNIWIDYTTRYDTTLGYFWYFKKNLNYHQRQ